MLKRIVVAIVVVTGLSISASAWVHGILGGGANCLLDGSGGLILDGSGGCIVAQ
jgi:hypothetical protein